jgi:hypothetical protein
MRCVVDGRAMLDMSRLPADPDWPRARLLGLTAVVAILLTLPSLRVGFAQDDYVFLSIFRGTPDIPVLEQSIWDTYTFSEGDLAQNAERKERGILPWWAVDGWKVDMWRPLPSLSHWLDFQCFGESPLPMHLHSILLYGAVCAMVAALFRAILGPAAWLGALVFAVDAAHGMTVGWLSNRHALYMTGLAVLSLLAHHRARSAATWTRPWGAGYPATIAAVLLGAALFCSEGAVGLGGYYFAYAVMLDPLARTRRDGSACALNPWGAARATLMLLPYLATVAAWRAIYSSFGHGTFGSWLYTDPLREPAAFLQHFPLYYPLSLFGLFGAPDCGIWMGLPDPVKGPVFGFVFAFLGFMVWGFLAPLRASAQARFLVLGCVLALVPACSTLPADRNLMLPSLGAAGLVGTTIWWYCHACPDRRLPRMARIFLALCIGVHLVLSPLTLPGASLTVAHMDRGFRHANDSAVPTAPEPGVQYIALNTPLDYLGASLPIYRAANGLPQPAVWRWLCAGPNPVRVERLDAHTLILRPHGGFLAPYFGQIFRRPRDFPMRAGEEVCLDGMVARVLDVSGTGRPITVQFTFEKSLDDPAFRWLTWSVGEYVPVAIPAPGASIDVPGLDLSLILWRLLESHFPGAAGQSLPSGQRRQTQDIHVSRS